MPELSELEYALTLANNAFQRWMVRCSAAAGVESLSGLEVQLLHSTNHRGRERTISDLCTMLNIEDTHVVAYAVKKLERLGLVMSGRRGKEKTVAVSEEGREACERYRDVRERLLLDSVATLDLDPVHVSRLAALLRTMSGQYDQAGRGAASL